MSQRTCPNCGETVPDGKYCAECGAPLAESEDASGAEEAREEPSEDALPPPPEEAGEPVEAEEPAEVAGAEQSGTDIPPSEPPTAAAPQQPAVSEGEEEPSEAVGVSPDELEPQGPHQEPKVAGATPMEQATESARAPGPPLDGQLRCPHCGEAVYEGERVCWNCSRRLEAPEEEPTERPQPPAGEPASGAPAVGPEQPRSGREDTERVSGAARPQERPAAEPSEEAMSYAWWSFGLGLLSVFTCGVLGLLGIAAIWLGISATRRDAGPVAIAGTVFGVMGVLILIAWVIALAIAMPQLLHARPTHVMLPGFF